MSMSILANIVPIYTNVYWRTTEEPQLSGFTITEDDSVNEKSG